MSSDIERYYEMYLLTAIEAGFREEDYLIFISNRYGIDRKWEITSNKDYVKNLIFKVGGLLEFIYQLRDSLDQEFNSLYKVNQLTSLDKFKAYLLETNVHTSPYEVNLRKEGLKWYEFIRDRLDN